MNGLTGKTFRLPTEAEWEYAARGGNKSQGYKYAGSNTIGNAAWYDGNSGNVTHFVATKIPNSLGIYDMTGNVWEWVQDWFDSYNGEIQINPTGPTSGSVKVHRGGGKHHNTIGCRVSFRGFGVPSYVATDVGLRLALDISPEPDDHEYVDLGLPSGTLWATCNVGADSPEEYGDYFAWGETEPKETYNWSTYKWCNGSSTTMTKYCVSSSYGAVDNKTELDPEDDAAYVNWGPQWCMPTQEQFEELCNSCTWKRATRNGVNGSLATGPNGNTLFLPASGYLENCSFDETGSKCRCWSSTLASDFNDSACFLCVYYMSYEAIYYYAYYRYVGHPVRAVRVSQN